MIAPPPDFDTVVGWAFAIGGGAALAVAIFRVVLWLLGVFMEDE